MRRTRARRTLDTVDAVRLYREFILLRLVPADQHSRAWNQFQILTLLLANVRTVGETIRGYAARAPTVSASTYVLVYWVVTGISPSQRPTENRAFY